MVGPGEMIGQILVEMDLSERLLRLAGGQLTLGIDILKYVAVVDVDVADGRRAAQHCVQREERFGHERLLHLVLRNHRLVEVERRNIPVDRRVLDPHDRPFDPVTIGQLGDEPAEPLGYRRGDGEPAHLLEKRVVEPVRICADRDQ